MNNGDNLNGDDDTINDDIDSNGEEQVVSQVECLISFTFLS